MTAAEKPLLKWILDESVEGVIEGFHIFFLPLTVSWRGLRLTRTAIRRRLARRGH